MSRAISFTAGLVLAAVACGGFYAEADSRYRPRCPASPGDDVGLSSCAWDAFMYGTPQNTIRIEDLIFAERNRRIAAGCPPAPADCPVGDNAAEQKPQAIEE